MLSQHCAVSEPTNVLSVQHERSSTNFVGGHVHVSGADVQLEVSYTIQARGGWQCCDAEHTVILPTARTLAQCQSFCNADVRCKGYLDFETTSSNTQVRSTPQ